MSNSIDDRLIDSFLNAIEYIKNNPGTSKSAVIIMETEVELNISVTNLNKLEIVGLIEYAKSTVMNMRPNDD